MPQAYIGCSKNRIITILTPRAEHHRQHVGFVIRQSISFDVIVDFPESSGGRSTGWSKPLGRARQINQDRYNGLISAGLSPCGEGG